MSDIVLKEIKGINTTFGEYNTDTTWKDIVFHHGAFFVRHKIERGFSIMFLPEEVFMIEFTDGDIHYSCDYLSDGPYTWRFI